MGKISLRRAQLVSPFGVGALCEVDGQSFFIKSTARWPGGKNLSEIDIPSLVAKLPGIQSLRKPEYFVSADRFPRWYFCPNCREMVNWTYHKDKREDEKDPLPVPECDKAKCKKRQLVPMRFIAVCDQGHIDEIDWYYWAHRGKNTAETGQCDRKTATLRFLVSGKSGGDFKSMHIACQCGAKRSLEGISDRALPQKCRGYFPGEGPQGCTGLGNGDSASQMWMEPRGSSALHYASVISALDIAQKGVTNDLSDQIMTDPILSSFLKMAKSQVEKNVLEVDQLATFYEDNVRNFSDQKNLDPKECWEAFVELVTTAEVDDAKEEVDETFNQGDVLGNEFPVLASPSGFDGVSLRCVAHPPPSLFSLADLFERVVQVEKLREVRVFRGFQRRDVKKENALVTPDLGVGGVNWLPAVEVSGEGIFIEFKKSALKAWLSQNDEAIREFSRSQLEASERDGLPSRMGFNANPVFIMVHTFAHLLINQLSFDCGYSSTSLRERIYCGPLDDLHAGVLIYTADSDAEGSMGGLVEMGSAENISEVVYRAVSRSEWCSGDPVCRELESQGLGGMNRAACHACSLVAETSCTFSNILLNRVLVSGDGRKNGRGKVEPSGFFQPVLKGA
jgi:hypothetical protein